MDTDPLLRLAWITKKDPLLHLAWITNKDPLYNMGDSAQRCAAAWMGRGLGDDRYRHMCG